VYRIVFRNVYAAKIENNFFCNGNAFTVMFVHICWVGCQFDHSLMLKCDVKSCICIGQKSTHIPNVFEIFRLNVVVGVDSLAPHF